MHRNSSSIFTYSMTFYFLLVTVIYFLTFLKIIFLFNLWVYLIIHDRINFSERYSPIFIVGLLKSLLGHWYFLSGIFFSVIFNTKPNRPKKKSAVFGFFVFFSRRIRQFDWRFSCFFCRKIRRRIAIRPSSDLVGIADNIPSRFG